MQYPTTVWKGQQTCTHSRQEKLFWKSTKMRATAEKCSKRTRSFGKKHPSTGKTNKNKYLNPTEIAL